MPWAYAIFARTVRRARLPLVFWMHTAPQGHWTERLAARTPPDLALCNSLFIGSKLPRIFPHRAGEIVYCPVDISRRLDSLPASVLAVREEFATPPEAIVIVQVGRMESLKGHSILLHALEPVARSELGLLASRRRATSSRTGLSGWPDTGRARVDISDRVKFLGHRSDVAHLLDAADIYCQPNLEPDAFGISFIEALGAGLPVVTTALGGALEIVDASLRSVGQNRTMQPHSRTPLRCLSTTTMNRHRLGAAGPARARELCDPDVALRRLDKLLERLHQDAPAA